MIKCDPEKPLRPLKAIRLKCLDCSGESAPEVRECLITYCPLWPYRLGRRPSAGEIEFRNQTWEGTPPQTARSTV